MSVADVLLFCAAVSNVEAVHKVAHRASILGNAFELRKRLSPRA